MKSKHSIAIAVALIAGALSIGSCNSGGMRSTPGKTYAPDMWYSRAYDAYTYNPNFANGQTSRTSVAGTVAMGEELPDHMKENDSASFSSFNTHLRFNAAELEEGKRLYDIYCGICHGQALDGQGPLYTSNKYAAAPANFIDPKYLTMSVGQMYHAIKYGKNMMGSYAAQINIKERWQVIAYIKKIQSENGGSAFILGRDEATPSTAQDTTTVAAATETESETPTTTPH